MTWWPLHPLWILGIGIAAVLLLILVVRIHAFLALITSAMLVGLLSGQIANPEKMTKVADAFGTAAGKIGVVIALAAIIGKCLMDSGAADRIVRAFVGVLGEKRAPWALLLSGYVLSVPVFFDTVFYLLVPLARATRIRTGHSYVVYILAIIAGGVATHSLVPPTPGPLAAGANLKVDIGHVMLSGLVIGLVCSVVPLLLVGAYARRFLNIPMRETSDISLAELEVLSKRPTSELPSLWLALAPIILPVILITCNTVMSTLAKREAEQLQAIGSAVAAAEFAHLGAVEVTSLARAAGIAQILGNANFALLLSTIVALWMLARSKRHGLRQLSVETQPALESAGVIILITAAGGAFGGMLQAAGVGEAIKEIAEQRQLSGITWLFLAFGVSSLLKVAQGSGTVAITVTSSMMVSMLPPAETLGYGYVYIVQAIGCGSMVGDWMNDSGFWVVCQMSGFTPEENLKTMSVLLAVMGFVGLGTTVLLAMFVPLV